MWDCKYFTWSLDNPRGFDVHLPTTARILPTTRDPRFRVNLLPSTAVFALMSWMIATSYQIHSQTAFRGGIGENVDELIEELGNLPLGIAQAAIYIRDLDLALSAYLKLLREKRQRMVLLHESFRDVPDNKCL